MFSALDAPSRRLYAALLADFTVFGIVLTVVGASLPAIIRSFGWSYAITGLVLASGAVGYFVSTFVCGLLIHKVAPKLLLSAGLAAGGACLAFFGRTPSPLVNLLLYLVVGLCQGAIEVVTNLEVIRMEPKGQSRLMNLMHASFSVGAVLGPALVGILAGRGAERTIFPLGGIAMAVMSPVFALIRFPRRSGEGEASERSGARVLGQPLLLLLVLMLLVYVGAELGVSNWVSEYFVKVLAAPISTGAFAVSLFWLGLLAGRVGVSFGYKGTRQQVLLLILSAVSAAALLAFVLSRSMALAAVFVFLTGAGYSAIYPLVMALVGKLFKSGVAVGAASTGGGIGSFTFPFIVAALFEVMGLRGGFGIYAGMSAALAIISLAIMRLIDERERRGEGRPEESR
jgi:MFS family permease